MKKEEIQVRVHPAFCWFFFAALAMLTSVILNGGSFLRVSAAELFFRMHPVPWTAALMVLYCFAFSDGNRRRIACSAACGALMGLMMLLGIRYSRNEIITISVLRSLVAFLAAASVFTALVSAFYRIMDRTKDGTPGNKEKENGFGRNFCLFFFLTMAVYVPVFLAVYPGIYSYDASVQIMQAFGVHPLTTHHPLIHTLYLYLCFKAGQILFGSFQAGMAMYALSQAVFLAAVFSILLWRMRRRGAPRLLLLVSWLYLVLNPYLTVFSFVTTKDVVFGAFFVLVFDLSFDLMALPKSFFQNRKLTVLFFVLVLFFCLFRNQGIYVYWFFAVFAFVGLWCRRERAEGCPVRFLLGSLAVTAVWFCLSGPIPGAMGIGKGDSREMLCVPMQQLARVWTEEPERLTEEEKEYIETVIDKTALESYVRVNADPVKAGFRTEVLKEDPGRFVSVWASVGRKNADLYFDSFCMGNWGYWYPGESQYWISYILFDGAFLEPEYNILNVRRNTHFPALEEKLRELVLTPVFDSVPVLSFVLNQAFPFWLMLTVFFWLVWKRSFRLLAPLSLLLGYWGTLLLGPVTSLRYVLPLLYCVPRLLEFFFHAGFASDGSSQSEKESD